MNTAAPKSGPAARFVSDARAGEPALSLDDVRVRRLFDIPFCDVTCEETLGLIDELVRARKPAYIATPNIDHVCRFHTNKAFRAAYLGARLVICDGMPLIWASRILGRPLRQKLSGSDLIYWISAHAAQRGYSVYFFGAQEGVAEQCAMRLCEKFPGLKVAGIHSPPYGFHADPAANADATQQIRKSGADIVYVALGSPKQEIWMCENADPCGIPVMIGIGGSFDFVSGRVRRAPEWMQRTSLEWVWRLCQEPRRLWRRYLIEDALIFKLFTVELWNTYGFGRARHGASKS
ncbi:MAG: WecB/TagA/CpsF family glycosyltransferase [Candidatus Hydrogenedentes bacterium]|nr:WecB/TagA/CpsF family glycosyltransferase [Candidatus Hydrogenedentota bacterium]